MAGSVLDRARGGDGAAFADLTAPHLPGLRLHCYRMLGSLVDAEDAVQETLLAAWRGLGGYAEQASLRTWLIRIATHRCLNMIRDQRRDRAPQQAAAPFPVPEPTRRSDLSWLQPLPDSWLTDPADPAPGPAARYESRDTVKLAFITALQRLPPRQTAALLLSDVLGYSTAETAALLGTTPTAVKGALQRARATMAADPAPTPTTSEDRDAEKVASRFAAAFTAGNVTEVIALLSDDAVLAMPPAPHEYVGAQPIHGFLTASFAWRRNRQSVLLPVRASTQPGFGCYLTGPGSDTAYAVGLFVLTTHGDTLRQAIRFQDPTLPRRFGLPDTTHPREPASGT